MCISLMIDNNAIENRPFARMLIRTLFAGTKSVIIFIDEILDLLHHSDKSSIHHRNGNMKIRERPSSISKQEIIGAGLFFYMGHEREQIDMLEEEFGALSIRSSSSIMSMVSSDLARSIPTSRLYNKSSNTVPGSRLAMGSSINDITLGAIREDVGADFENRFIASSSDNRRLQSSTESLFNRKSETSSLQSFLTTTKTINSSTSHKTQFNSNSVLDQKILADKFQESLHTKSLSSGQGNIFSNPTQSSIGVNAEEYGESLPRKRFRSISSRMGPFDLAKYFTRNKDSNFPSVLLELEHVARPHICQVDIVRIKDKVQGGGKIRRRGGNESWNAFAKILGEKLSKEEFNEQGISLAQRGRIPTAEFERVTIGRRPSATPSSSTGSKGFNPDLLNGRIAEIVINERKYLQKLYNIQKYLMNPLSECSSLDINDFKKIFGDIPDLIKIHEALFEEMTALIYTEKSYLEEIEDFVIQGDVKDGIISGDKILKALLNLSEDRKLGAYVTIFNDFEERVALLKKLPATDEDVAKIISMFENPFLRNLESNSPRSASHSTSSSLDTIEYHEDPPCDYELHRKSLPKKTLFKNSQNIHPVLIAGKSPRNSISCGGTSLMDVMANLFQHPMRYQLLVGEVIKAFPENDSSLDSWQRLHRLLDEMNGYLNCVRQKSEDTVRMFELQGTIIANCPADLIKARRIFVTKTTFWEVDRGAVSDDARITLFIFNDIVIGCRKMYSSSTFGKRGSLGRKHSASTPNESSSKVKSRPRKYEFLFWAAIEKVYMTKNDTRVRVKKVEKSKCYLLSLPLSALVWVASEQRVKALCETDGTKDAIKSQYLLVPKHHEKCANLLERIEHFQHQHLLSQTCQEIYLSRDSSTGIDTYFYIYSQEEYLARKTKQTMANQIAVLFIEGDMVLDSIEIQNIDASNESTFAIVVIQAYKESFRVHARMREALFTSEEFLEASQQLLPAATIKPIFKSVLNNCHLLATMYPPFGPDRQLHQRQALERLVLPFTKGLFKKLRELINRMQKTNVIEDDRTSIFSIERCHIDFDDGLDADGKPLITIPLSNIVGKSNFLTKASDSKTAGVGSGKKSILGRLMDRIRN